MQQNYEVKPFSSRAFIAAVRAKLDAGGYADVAVDRQWIGEGAPGMGLLLQVPVGSELIMPLILANGSRYEDAYWDRCASHCAVALVNLSRGRGAIEEFVGDMRRAARAEIAAAREDGLDLVLEGVALAPTHAFHLDDASWKRAVESVLAEIRVRNTSFFLQPETSVFCVADAERVEIELRDLREEQTVRQARLAELAELGADLEVDQITLDILQAHGIDPVEALRQVWRNQQVDLEARLPGKEVHLSLTSSEGRVTPSLMLNDAVWNDEHLWFRVEERFAGHEDRVGTTLGDLVAHPVLSRLPVVEVQSGPVQRIGFGKPDAFRFDADSGRIWSDERLAA